MRQKEMRNKMIEDYGSMIA